MLLTLMAAPCLLLSPLLTSHPLKMPKSEQRGGGKNKFNLCSKRPWNSHSCNHAGAGGFAVPGQPQKLFLPPAGPSSQLASWVFAARLLCLAVEIAFVFCNLPLQQRRRQEGTSVSPVGYSQLFFFPKKGARRESRLGRDEVCDGKGCCEAKTL